VISTPPDPQNWNVKDTSVQIATAIRQAAGASSSDMSSVPTNPNHAWASGSQPRSVLPRSTSVEYEKETQTTLARRLGAPPSRGAQGPNAGRRPPISKSASLRHVSDSEGDQPSVGGRAKSPFGQALEMAQAAVQPLSIFMRQRSREPEQPQPNGRAQNESYDYSQEERDFQAQKAAGHKRTTSSVNKKNKISEDNRAYKPSASDLDEESEEEASDGGRRRRRKKGKRDSIGGPLTTLPVAGYDKRRKRRSRKGGDGAEDEEIGSGSEEEEQVSEQVRNCFDNNTVG
jgi:SUN domain-containing protein 1/2